jgi:hypothetical protein
VRTAEVLRRLEAWRVGAPTPVGDALPWPRVAADDRLIVAFLRMAGEARPWGVALGHPGATPTFLTAAEPRDAGEYARLALALGKALLPHLPHPDTTGDADDAAVRATAAPRQLWLPGATHVDMLHLLDYRFSRANLREDADARELGKIGRACGWLFRESTRPGQVRVIDATARLREAFTVPAEDVRQQHIGYLLAWIEPANEDRGSREARLEGARRAEALSVGVTMQPAYEAEHLVALVAEWNASRGDAARLADVAARIHAVLTPELARRFALTERAIAALEGDAHAPEATSAHAGGRPANTELGAVVELGVEEFVWQYWSRERKAAEPVSDPDAPRFLGDHPETDFLPTQAAARFFAHAHAAEVTLAALLHGDRQLVTSAIEAGDAVLGTITSVVNEGTKRAVTPVWRIAAPADRPLRLREDSLVCVVGLRGRTGKIRSIGTDGEGTRVLEVQIDGWKRARPDEGALSADAKELEGTSVVLASAGVVGISKRKSMAVWDASGPGAWLTHAAPPPEAAPAAPVEGDLVDLVEKLGGA